MRPILDRFDVSDEYQTRCTTSATASMDLTLDQVAAILDLCHGRVDDAVLSEICRRVRRHMNAAAVSVTVPDGSAWATIASAGRPADSAIAGEMSTLQSDPISRRWGEGFEAAAPAKYAGTVVGVLLARWTLDASADPLCSLAPLRVVAAAIAPILAGASDRRETPMSRVPELLGVSSAMRDVRRAVERAAAVPFPVLIEGESGTGKELVARALHRIGPRRDRGFCVINCAALQDELIEAELFGHSRGAFTGAINMRPGLFEEAHGGTLFLDEIGELSMRGQAKLLRALQDGEVRRVGENIARRMDVRVIAATNRDLRQEAAENQFREDLLYRLSAIRIFVPPLRDRREDIAGLADHFWKELSGRVGSHARLAVSALAALTAYDWPGNARELQNVLTSLIVSSSGRGVVANVAQGLPSSRPRTEEVVRLDEARKAFDERFVRAALASTGGHRGRAAHKMGLTRQGLAKLIARLKIV